METSSEMMPASQVPQGNFSPIRLPESDSSTCLAWHAYDKDSGRHLFIKQLRPELAASPKYRNAFIKEYHVGRKLSSAYFPHYHTLEDSPRGLFLTMDFIDGESLSRKMLSSPRFFLHRQNTMRFIRQLLEAMDTMHRADIVHLDLKPDNIIITNRTGNVKIIDFGYSQSGEWSMATGMTRAFASPEQLLGKEAEIGATSDIYSFARIIQEIVWQTGCRLPRYLHHIMDCCMSERPEKRFATAREILDEIDSHIAIKKKQLAKVSLTSILLTCLFFATGYFGYRYYTQDSFEVNGLRYHILKNVWVAEREEDVVELLGKTADATPDSVFRIPNTVMFRNHEYKVFQVADHAFEHNSWIKKIVFPEEMRFCLEYAFVGCENLEEAEVQQNMSFLDKGVFTDCPKMRSLKVSRKNPYLYVEDDVMYCRDPFLLVYCLPCKSGDYSIPDGVLGIEDKAFKGCTLLTGINIPESVGKIKPDAFMDCHSLKSVCLSTHVVDIENSIFENCYSLQDVTLSERAVILGLHSFEQCRSLREFTIPASMIRFGYACFVGTDSLDTLINLATVPQEVNSHIFSHYGNLYVPDESVKAYQADSIWGRFSIHPLSERP